MTLPYAYTMSERAARQGMTVEQYREKNRVYKQRSRGALQATRPEPETCECCGAAPSGRYKKLCLDHCHVTGKFRGWICHDCGVRQISESLTKNSEYSYILLTDTRVKLSMP